MFAVRFRLEWHQDKFARILEQELLKDLDEAGALVAARARALVSSPSSPSPPGAPPARVSGALQASIGHAVEQGEEGPRAVVFAATPYARRLELGFFGTDTLGRRYTQAPRPFLRRALQETELAPAFA